MFYLHFRKKNSLRIQQVLKVCIFQRKFSNNCLRVASIVSDCFILSVVLDSNPRHWDNEERILPQLARYFLSVLPFSPSQFKGILSSVLTAHSPALRIIYMSDSIVHFLHCVFSSLGL
jgi:hypothetical protein